MKASADKSNSVILVGSLMWHPNAWWQPFLSQQLAGLPWLNMSVLISIEDSHAGVALLPSSMWHGGCGQEWTLRALEFLISLSSDHGCS